MNNLFRSWRVVALLAVASMAVGCAAPADEPNYASQVNDRLRSANIEDVRADWKNDEKTLHLTGEVQSAADRNRAEELAQQVVGTTGRIVNEVKVEGSTLGDGTRLPGDSAAATADDRDDQIEEQLTKMFEDRTEWDFDGKGVSFDANAGVVTITGNVESQAVKDRIGERARKTAGVRDVVNKLEVKGRNTR